jgi:hypothetical protein
VRFLARRTGWVEVRKQAKEMDRMCARRPRPVQPGSSADHYGRHFGGQNAASEGWSGLASANRDLLVFRGKEKVYGSIP